MSNLEPAETKTEETEASRPSRAPLKERLLLFLIMAAVLLLDQLTKYLVIVTMPLYTTWAPFPAIEQLFRITHTTNTGAAFGLFPNGSLIFAVLAIIVSGAIIYYNHTLAGGHWALRVALGLQLGGALGNLIDRLRLGYVTDFLDFGPWPVFNVADTAVVSGVVLLAWLMLREQREESQRNVNAAAEADQ